MFGVLSVDRWVGEFCGKSELGLLFRVVSKRTGVILGILIEVRVRVVRALFVVG